MGFTLIEMIHNLDGLRHLFNQELARNTRPFTLRVNDREISQG
jgi:hypothetical protein